MYLETGATPIRWIIPQRRVNYLKNILERDDDELVKKVFLAQHKTPLIGDFAHLVKNVLINLNITQSQVETLSRND